MKKLFILFTLCLGVSLHMYSQASAMSSHNISGANGVPTQGGTTFGLFPSDSLLPCSVQGVNTFDTIYFTNLSTVNYMGFNVTLTSLTIDSIYLPNGLSWQTNSSTNTFAGGGHGVITVTGSTNDSAGQYKLRIIVHAVAFGTTVNNINGESEGLVYRIKVRGLYCPCPATDDSQADSAQVFIPYPACPPTVSITGQDTICPSGSTTLTASAGTAYTYKWSNPAHSTTQSISVNTAGSYQVTVYQGSDSAVSTPVTVVQGTNPSATLTLHGLAAICPGNIDTISAPTGSHYTYRWNTTATTPSITVNSAGTYSVVVTNSYGCSATSANEVISANPNCTGPPVAVITPAGHDTICPGGSVVLAATQGAGYSYKWSNAAHSTTDSITVSTGGAYTVTVYHSTDSTVSAPTTIVIAATPSTAVTLNGSNTLCLGDSTQLSAAAGLSYHWSTSATTQSIEVSTTGSYTVTVTNSNGCTAVTSPQSITVNTPAADTITRAGLVLTSQPQSSYQWYQGSTLLTGDNAASYTAIQNGTYSVQITDANGCQSVSNSITIVGVGINEVAPAIALTIYPNPSEGVFTLQAPGCEGNYYEINDELGRSVQKGVIMSASSTIDVRGQIQGVYFLTVKTGEQSQTIRFTVIK